MNSVGVQTSCLTLPFATPSLPEKEMRHWSHESHLVLSSSFFVRSLVCAEEPSIIPGPTNMFLVMQARASPARSHIPFPECRVYHVTYLDIVFFYQIPLEKRERSHT